MAFIWQTTAQPDPNARRPAQIWRRRGPLFVRPLRPALRDNKPVPAAHFAPRGTTRDTNPWLIPLVLTPDARSTRGIHLADNSPA